MKKRLTFLGFCLASSLVLASCNSTEPAASTTTTGSVEESTSEEPKVPAESDVEGNLLSDGVFSSDHEISKGNKFEGWGSWGLWLMDGMMDGQSHIKVNSNRECCIDSSKMGVKDYSIQFGQKGITMVEESTYKVKLDIWAESPQTATVLVQQDYSPYTPYFKQEFQITTEKQTLEWEFTCTSTDEKCSFVFNIGKYPQDDCSSNKVYFDNVSLVCTHDSGALQKPVCNILVNQVGYLPDAKKTAVIRGDWSKAAYQIINLETEAVVKEGVATDMTMDYLSRDRVRIVDFSDLTTPGKYKIVSEGSGESFSFEIKENAYNDVFDAAAHMLYLQRCGYEVEDELFGHEACHTAQAKVYGTNDLIDVNGGWHDAGDYGKYVVPGAKAVEDMMISYEKTGKTSLLEEVDYELEWMLKMQKDTGEVYHKVSTYEFPGPEMKAIDDTGALVVSPVSYAATADFAAVMAHAAYLYKESDAEKADTYKQAALKAYTAMGTMEKKGFTNPEEIKTGEYPDTMLKDETQFAAISLYRLTGEAKYLADFDANFDESLDVAYGWDMMTAYAYRIYLATNKTGTKAEAIKKALTAKATTFKENIEKSAYGDPLPFLHEWGSNLTVCGAAMLMMDLMENTDSDYDAEIMAIVDYLFGKNATEYCFVTGFGDKCPVNPHHRPSVAIRKAMPGMLVGGPNNDYENNGGDAIANSKLMGKVSGPKAYIDHDNAWSVNEVTIYWNSPLLVVLSYFQQTK